MDLQNFIILQIALVQKLAVVTFLDVVLLLVASLQLDVDRALVGVLGDEYFELPDGEVAEDAQLDVVRIDALPQLHLVLKCEPLDKSSSLQLPMRSELRQAIRFSALEEPLHGCADELQAILLGLLGPADYPVLVDALEALHAFFDEAAVDGVLVLA